MPIGEKERLEFAPDLGATPSCVTGVRVRPSRASSAGSALVLMLAGASAALASPASDGESETRIDAAGTVIIGGNACQLIALDDGRFVTLQSGALPKTPLPVKARIKIVAEPSDAPSCAHAMGVDVKAFHRLPDLLGR